MSYKIKIRTIENYKKKVECMIDQYNNYTSSQVNRSVIDIDEIK